MLTVEVVKNIFGEAVIGRYKVNRIRKGRYGLRTAEGVFIMTGTADQVAAVINKCGLKTA